LRSATLDRVEREFEPPLPSYAAALAVSPDDRLVAARAQSDTILVWNATTGALVKEIRHADLTRAGHRTLTFSPDGRKLAVALVEQACVVDVESGTLESRLPQIAVQRFAWSADGQVLTTVSEFVHYERNEPPQLFNVYPTVQDWDWRTAKLLRDRSQPREQGSSRPPRSSRLELRLTISWQPEVLGQSTSVVGALPRFVTPGRMFLRFVSSRRLGTRSFPCKSVRPFAALEPGRCSASSCSPFWRWPRPRRRSP
jgi:hypothetical protein